MIFEIIKVEALVDITYRDVDSDITKTESNNCFVIHCFKENNDKRIRSKKRINQPCCYFTVRTMPHHP